jgi:hypothetical protein
MTTTHRTFTRSNSDTPWYHETSDATASQINFDNQLSVAYLATGKIIERTISETPTTLIIAIQWDSVESMNEHYSDPITLAHFAERDVYNTANGIETTLTQL